MSAGLDLFGSVPIRPAKRPPRIVTRSAVFSDEPVPLHRYRLERYLHREGRTAALIGVNPSTASDLVDDATVVKLYGFADQLGIARWIVGNPFAFRATDVRNLADAADPIGPDNDRHLEQILRDADLHIVAWGPVTKLPARLRERWREVVAIAARVGCPLHALATAQCGHPKHPLRLGYECRPTPWSAPA